MEDEAAEVVRWFGGWSILLLACRGLLFDLEAMEDGFQKATSQNLPSVHMFDVYNFFLERDAFVSAEFRMKKLEK